MHFTIDRKYFYEKISTVSRAISPFSPIPALSGILIQVNEDRIELTGSDSNISIRSVITKGELNQLNIQAAGSIVIESRYLLEIVRKMDCAMIEIEKLDHSLIGLSGNNGTFRLNGTQAQEYPNIDFSAPSNSFIMKGSDLKKIVSQTVFACSDKDQRPVLNGVNFRAREKMLYCSATDSYRLARKVLPLNETMEFNITIPAKSLTEVTRSLENEEDDIVIYVDHKKAQFILDKTVIQTRLLDGTFPDVERIIPSDFVSTMEINARELSSSIDRTNFIRNDKVHLIKLECSPEICRIKTNSVEIGNSDEVLTDCVYKGDDLTISCNGTYMLDAVRALNCERAVLNFSGYMKPIRIDSAEDDSVLMIVVPLRSYD